LEETATLPQYTDLFKVVRNQAITLIDLVVKAGVCMKAVFLLGIMVLMQISRSRFKQSRISLLIPHIYVF